MITQEKKEHLERQGYRLVSNHSAIKVCMWTKRCIRDEDVCYKKTFYGIDTARCVQMTPALHICPHRCLWCWRDIEHTNPVWDGQIDEPSDIIDGSIEAHKKYLIGFKGNKDIDLERFEKKIEPKHFAISLTGEPTSYPKLPEMIEELDKRKLTSFLVTNGTNPDMLQKLLDSDSPVTQVYMTLPAPDKESYLKSCRPMIKDGWERIMKSLSILNKFERNVVRLTLAKGVNMHSPEKYAELIKEHQPLFVEAKGYAWVGFSRENLEKESMPRHSEILEFTNKLAELTGYKLIDQKENSRVTLLMKEDFKGRVMKF